MRLWEIIKLADEKKLMKGDQFKAINIPFDLILEFDEDDSLVYNTIMGNAAERKAVSLCSGELGTEYVKIETKTEIEYKNVMLCFACGAEFKETDELNYNNIYNCPFCGCSKDNNLSLISQDGRFIIKCNELRKEII